MKFYILKTFLFMGFLSHAQAGLNCGQWGLMVGLYPRIVIDEEQMIVKIEHAGLPFIDSYSFSDTIKLSTDTLENEIVRKERFIHASGQALEWIITDSLKKAKVEEIGFNLSEYPDQQILLIKEIEHHKKKGVIVIGKREPDPSANEPEPAYFIETYLSVDGELKYLETCGAGIWTELERVYISNFYFNDFPIILALETGENPDVTKRLRLIFNIGESITQWK